MGWHFLLQGIFPTQGLSLHFLHWQVDPVPLSHQGRLWAGVGRPILQMERSEGW